MLSIIGFLMIIVILVLLLTNRAIPAVAFVGPPLIAGLIAGFPIKILGGFIVKGMTQVYGVVGMFVFAILFFGVVSDAGLFDRLVNKLTKFAGSNITLVTLTTAVIAMLAHLEGVGAATFLITIPAMLPIYKKLKLDPLNLMLLVGASAGVANMLPWAGPVLRTSAVLKIDAVSLWLPLLPVQLLGFVLILFLAIYVARKEKAAQILRGAYLTETVTSAIADDEKNSLKSRPHLLWFNVLLTIAALASLVLSVAPPSVVFMIATAIALSVNYRDVKMQAQILRDHAPGAMLVAVTLLSAGCFLGILGETGMITAMAKELVGFIPPNYGKYLHIIIAFFAVPLGMAFGPDAYYFGLLPIIAEIATSFNIPTIDVGRAILIGENVGWPVSPAIATVYLGVGLANVQIGDHIKHSFFWLWALSAILLCFAMILGVF